ncbi:MAG TPA: hypothetical protein ENI15_04540 [Spirochaetes bacterium]|nr:hypothetical protein [Spirochaetota bacterium]
MLIEELAKKSKNEIEQTMHFWGLTESGSLNDITGVIGQKRIFAGSLLKLNQSEHLLLHTLFINDSVCIKGELENSFKTGVHLDEVIKSLLEKSFIYLRKDRGLLTDRHDKIYLFPAIVEALKSFRMFDEEALREHLMNLQHPMIILSKKVPERLEKLILAGWVALLNESDDDRLSVLYKKGLVDIVLAEKNLSFMPLWVVTEKVSKYVDQGSDNLHYRSNLYFNNITSIADCLLHMPLKKKYFRKNLGTCLNRLPENTYSADRYLRELKYLEIIKKTDDAVSLDASFALSSFDKKLALLKNRMIDDEKQALECVENKGQCSKIYVTSAIMMNKIIKKVFYENPEELNGCSTTLVDDLTFRGFLLEDFSGSFVRPNSFDARKPEKDSVIVNTDFEILIFSERIPQYVLYVLAGFSNVMQNSEIIKLKIDRFSVSRGIAYSGDIELFIDILTDASKGQISSNVISAVREWSLSFLEVDVKDRFIIRIDSPDTRFRLFHNRYIQSIVEEETEKFLVLKPDADINQLRLELRKENIYIKLPE